MGRILLLRHGQASLLEDDYDRLSPLGERQARLCGEWLAARMGRVSLVARGSLQRQEKTLDACLDAAGWAGLAATATVDPAFDEYNHHDLFAQAHPQYADPAVLGAHLRAQAQPQREFQRLFAAAFDGWLRGTVAGRDGLTWPAFRARCQAALARVAAALGAGETALVVTSGGPIAALAQGLLGIADERAALLHDPLWNASFTELRTRRTDGRDTVALFAFNVVAHLPPDLVTHR